MGGTVHGRWHGTSPRDNEQTIASWTNALRAYEGKSSEFIPPGPRSRVGTSGCRGSGIRISWMPLSMRDTRNEGRAMGIDLKSLEGTVAVKGRGRSCSIELASASTVQGQVLSMRFAEATKR